MFEIGNTLREARLRRALDIADCESATKIRAKYLRALEEEQFEVLPGPTYVKGFLRTYAEYLELDGRLVLDEYESRSARSDHPHHPDGDPTRRRAKRRRNREGRVLLVASSLVLVASTGLWVGFADDRNEQPPAPVVEVTPIRAEFSPAGNKPTYLEVRKDGPKGETLFTPGPVPAGTTRAVDARPPIWVYVGEGSGLRLVVDGAPVKTPPGKITFVLNPGGGITPSTTP
jgi:Helix-turn-helix domain